MKKQASPPQNPQSGSIFVWLFIMIALFGALSYAMIQSGRQGVSNVTTEQAKLMATEILQQAENMGNTIRTLRINGCADNQISFEGEPTTTINYTNPSAPSDYKCHVFRKEGGGLNWQKPSTDMPLTKWFITGTHCYEAVGSLAGCTISEKELELNLVNIPDSVCLAINKLSGINDSGVIPNENYSTTVDNSGAYKGTFNAGTGSTYAITGINAFGKRFGCYKDNLGVTLNQNFFFYVLIAR